MELRTMTEAEQEATRRTRRNEPGTEPPCPMCGKPRVKRSTYIRCNPCAVNWSEREDTSSDPTIERYAQLIRDTRSRATKTGTTATPATSGSESSSEISTKAWRDQQANKIRRKLGMPLPEERDSFSEPTKKGPLTAAPLAKTGSGVLTG
jgi:hypothetical protein